MQTQHLAPDIAEEQARLVHLRHSTRRDPDLRYPPSGASTGWHPARSARVAAPAAAAERSRTDHTIPFPQTRQAVLKALRRAHDQHRPTD
jgi:hypothetical protein